MAKSDILEYCVFLSNGTLQPASEIHERSGWRYSSSSMMGGWQLVYFAIE